MFRFLPAALLVASLPFAANSQSGEDRKLLQESDAVDRMLELRGLVYHDQPVERYLADLARPMLPPSSPDYVRWRFRILREPLMNAMAAPNGSVYVTTGLLAALENDDQLAGVLGHEITHVTNQHTFQFAKSYRKKVVISEVIGAAASWTPISGPLGATVVVLANAADLTMVVTLLGYGRSLEKESDVTAVSLLKEHHRDAAQLTRTFELLDERLDPEPTHTFWRDHPKTVERIAYTQEMNGGRKVEHPVTDSAYLARMRSLILHNVCLDLASRRFRTAVARTQRLVDADPGDREALYWLGESYRALGPRTVQPSDKERTDRGQNVAHKKIVKRTEEEETRDLAATPEGKAALLANETRAAEYFANAADFPQAHFGMGQLYEQQHKPADAAAEYRKYLDLAPDSAEDRPRAARRLEALSKQ